MCDEREICCRQLSLVLFLFFNSLFPFYVAFLCLHARRFSSLDDVNVWCLYCLTRSRVVNLNGSSMFSLCHLSYHLTSSISGVFPNAVFMPSLFPDMFLVTDADAPVN